MWRKQGFTLIELMIVVAIIAIIAAIAIPNLLTSRMSANEVSATSGLKTLVSTEAVWYQQDSDGNGRKDYWTYDVGTLHRYFRADKATKVAAIDMAFAKADFLPQDMGGATFGAGISEDWSGFAITQTPKSGYYFRSMGDDLTVGGSGLSSNEVGGVAACNSGAFSFMAAPDVYGSTGVNSFIVNQAGTVYRVDVGSAADRWETDDAGAYDYPANPSGTTHASGRIWGVAE